MPLATVNGLDLHYALDGPDDAPTIVFSNSLGTSLEMWDMQVRALCDRFRCLRYDTRGHGRSAVRDEPAGIDDLAGDLCGLLDALGIAKAHVVGLSLGGMTAQAFAAAHPKRVERLVLMATAARLGPASSWEERAAIARRDGMAALVDTVLARWFTPAFVDRPEARAVRAQILTTNPAGYARACGAIGDMDLRDRLAAIAAPSLIIAGAEDPATPPPLAEALRSAISGAQLVVLSGAAHLLNIEQAEQVNRHLASFLGAGSSHTSGGVSFTAGLVNRKAVLGEEHVARSLAAAGDFAGPWQDFITRYAWGEIWGDPTLPRKTRSLVTLGLMIALNREEEFKLHVRPALRNGVTHEELRALLKQTAIYAGVPAANGAFRWVREVLGDELQ